MGIDAVLPVANAETRPFWEGTLAGELRLPYCAACARHHYPPMPRCPSCRAVVSEWRTLSGRATLHGCTDIHVPAVPGKEPPVLVAEVEPVEQPGLRLVVFGDDALRDAKPGTPVVVGFGERRGDVRLPFAAVAEGGAR